MAAVIKAAVRLLLVSLSAPLLIANLALLPTAPKRYALQTGVSLIRSKLPPIWRAVLADS
jgi:hypothetical protein